MNNIVMIAAVEAESAAQKAGPSVEEKVKAAMKATRSHWLATDENDRFVAAVEGAARCVSEEDLERIQFSMRMLQSLSVAASGVPVDFGALIPDDPEDRLEPYPLSKWWEETA